MKIKTSELALYVMVVVLLFSVISLARRVNRLQDQADRTRNAIEAYSEGHDFKVRDRTNHYYDFTAWKVRTNYFDRPEVTDHSNYFELHQ